MIAVDTNILVYAHRRDSPWHARAIERLRELAENTRRWGVPWPCVHEFLAVVTHPRIYKPPTELLAALGQIDYWRESPGFQLLGQESGYWEIFRAMAIASRVRGPQIHDARIAAICQERGVSELWSADRDFSRFPGLRVTNPLN